MNLNYYKSFMMNNKPPEKPKLIGIAEPHTNFECGSIGLAIDKEYPFLGASPDARFQCDCCDFGVIEIKCPYSLRASSLSQVICDNKQFYVRSENNCYVLKRGHPYYTQVQMEMRVSDAKSCDFVVWTPSEVLILKVKEDILFQKDLCMKLTKNWIEYILPELVTRKLEKSSTTRTKQQVQVPNYLKKTYCVCKTTVAEGEMVGCDMCDDWFHPSCLKLVKLPTAKVWYCPKCRKSKKQKLDDKD